MTERDEAETRVFTVAGSRFDEGSHPGRRALETEVRTWAEQLINDVLAEAEAGGSGMASRRGTGDAGSEHFEMKIPSNKVGLVIGKGGETIKSMQARTGARIQVIPLHLPPGDTSTERSLHIDGTSEQIKSARELVDEVISEKLWVANLGDSRAVLSKSGQAIQMSIDHEPNTERGSIENRGGFVSNMPGDVARVDGQLAVSRAFGDKNLKSHLRSDPDVQNADIDSDTELLILASDGIWKVMSNQEAVDIVKKTKDPQRAAQQLVTEALNEESKDDISCIVVRFKG